MLWVLGVRGKCTLQLRCFLQRAQTTIDQWRDSPGHYANMISDRTVVGYGYYVCGDKVFWTGIYS